MSAIEDKVRRRLAPFVVEGKIGSPQFSAVNGGCAERLTVNVQLKSSRERSREVENALFAAVQDLGADAQLVITGA
ncbi:MAG: hypothetical protein KDJ20_00640 [Hyphomicrobiales bacterium]|nr:hypothetical protein [Rhodoblastus sp.]MCC2102633.1 hypothetical protein [Hyphomicrobiales bacterium]MCC2109178.1 hypothetical protein [Hyphomicrobiales bacterium]